MVPLIYFGFIRINVVITKNLLNYLAKYVNKPFFFLKKKKKFSYALGIYFNSEICYVKNNKIICTASGALTVCSTGLDNCINC
jgi:hypothetical protein